MLKVYGRLRYLKNTKIKSYGRLQRFLFNYILIITNTYFLGINKGSSFKDNLNFVLFFILGSKI